MTTKKIIHTVIKGDTVYDLAIKHKTTIQEIIKLNPAVFLGREDQYGREIYPGEQLIILSQKLIEAKKTISEEGLILFIDDKKYQAPVNLSINYFIDTFCDVCLFSYPVSYSNKEFQNILDPLQLQDVQVYYDKELLFDGEIEKVKISLTKEGASSTFAARSKTRILDKSSVPPSFKKEHKNINLSNFICSLCLEFGIKCTPFNSKQIPQIVVENGETVFNLIKRLCIEQNIILTNNIHNVLHAVDISQSLNPVYNFDLNSDTVQMLGVDSLDIEIDSTKLFGTYICRTQDSKKKNAGRQSIYKNKLISEQSYTYLKSEEPNATTSKIEMQIKRSIAEMFSQSIPFPDVKNPNNNTFWKVGDCVSLKSEQSGILEPKKYIIDEVKMLFASGKLTSILNIKPLELFET